MDNRSTETRVIPPDRLSEFWRGIYPEGMTIEQVNNELHDLEFMAEQVPKVYMHVTGGRISKPNTYAHEVISEHDNRREDDIDEAIKEHDEDWPGGRAA